MFGKKATIFASAILLWACAPAADLQTPAVTLSDIRPSGRMTAFEQRYDVALRIQNPNQIDLPLDGLSYAVALNGQDFARGVSHDRETIPALGEGIVHVMVSSNALDWIRQIAEIQAHPDTNPSYKVSGTIYVRGYNNTAMPFSQSGTFTPGR
ncbi:MAG TPA: LEA type 2 family protein [Patescibacteria group bacterium]|nr:LEA type 2 family protein [Patescibacteria group bacterium]